MGTKDSTEQKEPVVMGGVGGGGGKDYNRGRRQRYIELNFATGGQEINISTTLKEC